MEDDRRDGFWLWYYSVLPRPLQQSGPLCLYYQFNLDAEKKSNICGHKLCSNDAHPLYLIILTAWEEPCANVPSSPTGEHTVSRATQFTNTKCTHPCSTTTPNDMTDRSMSKCTCTLKVQRHLLKAQKNLTQYLVGHYQPMKVETVTRQSHIHVGAYIHTYMCTYTL